MTKALIIDLNACNGCHNCQIACKDEHVENDWPPYAAAQPDIGQFWMKVKQLERGTYPRVKLAYVMQPCMHCDNAPCMKAATGGAVYKRDDGIVIIDPVKSAGQQAIQSACPYGAIYWNEATGIPQKCTFCAHLLDKGWKEPRCVEACPIQGCMTFGEYEKLKGTIKAKGAVPLNPEYGTQPRVFYVGIPKAWITGSVVDKAGECVEGANVSAMDLATLKTVTTKSDNYGDFWLDGLEPQRTFIVRISKPGMASLTRMVSLYKDTDLGEVKI